MTRPKSIFLLFFFNDTATTEIYTLSLHDALPILSSSFLPSRRAASLRQSTKSRESVCESNVSSSGSSSGWVRSEEHTSELQSPDHLVCRLLLEKKNRQNHN